ncbi:MmgE/PrpD family protein [Nocardioides sp. zg-DK7169]|uniref:MmgE/PrpD family protein n=1 Tax=Nocardioides sp. zg-DK7169 TaxID=2736600 RepID=UPI001557F8BB|nr:MmgE/PrpD family protein [Nocardioides sp. zg-DK7169]
MTPTVGDRGLTEVVAAFACAFTDAGADTAAVVGSLVDTVGVAVAGRTAEPVQAVRRWVGTEPALGGAVVWGEGARRAPSQAALLNGVAGHALDFDDACPSMPLHPSTVLWPALLADADVLIDGARVVEAVHVGNAVNRALGEALPMDVHYGRGWHSTATVGRLAAVAALARLHALDLDTTRRALGLVASMAGGSIANFGTGAKPLHAGLAARDAVSAVALVRHGLDANPEQLEHRLGFLAAFGAPDPDAVARVGQRLEHWYAAWSQDWSLKRYPSCYGTHRAVDAALEVRAELGAPSAGEYTSVEVLSHPGSLRPLIGHAPRTGLEGKFSLPHTVATALLTGRLGLEAFTDEAVTAPEVVALADRVEVVAQPDPPGRPELADQRYARVRATLRDGRSAERLVLLTRGDARNPLSDAEVDEKFLLAVSAGGWSAAGARRLLDRLRASLTGEHAALGAALAALGEPAYDPENQTTPESPAGEHP